MDTGEHFLLGSDEIICSVGDARLPDVAGEGGGVLVVVAAVAGVSPDIESCIGFQ